MAALERGDPAPDFDLQDGNGKTWSLRELKGRRVILYFYPADFTPGCTLEACDFRDNLSAFEGAGVQVLGVSNQSSESHRQFAKEHGLEFPLLADEDLSVAEAYGARGKERALGDIPLSINRSTFVIDENGNIEQALYGVNAQGHVAELRESIVG